MPKRIPGLMRRWSQARQAYIWEIDKRIGGERIRRSTGTTELSEATQILALEIEQARRRQIFGETTPRMFTEAVDRYLTDFQHKRSLDRDAQGLAVFMPYIGHLPLHNVHQGTLQPAVDARRRAGKTAGTINRDLAAVKRVLHLAARLWRDELGRPWLQSAPMIPTLPAPDRRMPYPLTWDEQRLLFGCLPPHLLVMALCSVHTGMRDQEVCGLQWSMEHRIDGHSVFIIPSSLSKTASDRIVVFNRVAQSVIDQQRQQSSAWVFPYRGNPIARMNNHGWRSARAEAAAAFESEIGSPCPWGFANVRVHDLRHTFGRRLRAAGVSEEDRRDLLGHRGQSVTTHYSAAEIHRMIEAADTVCDGQSRPMLRVVR